MKKHSLTILAVVLLLAGAAVLAYPAVSSWINDRNGSYVIQAFREELERTDSRELARQRLLARAYNADPAAAGQEYESILNFGGMMGYIDIPAIDVHLPIYHGVSSQVLAKGVGHLPESDFPVGGEGYHAVLTGHTGLPGSRLFTDLTELEQGDVFYIHILEETLVYRVDQITVVLSHETGDLTARAGEDYCTLVTCTPYGVNSHRLLVRGERVEAAAAPEPEPEAASGQANPRWAAAVMAANLLLDGILLAVLCRKERGK